MIKKTGLKLSRAKDGNDLEVDLEVDTKMFLINEKHFRN